MTFSRLPWADKVDLWLRYDDAVARRCVHELLAEEAARLGGNPATLGRRIRDFRDLVKEGQRAGVVRDDLLPGALRANADRRYEEIWTEEATRLDRLYEWVGRDPSRSPPEPPPRRGGNNRRVLVIADPHGAPYMEGITQAVARYEPDELVIAGDILDCLAFSQWPGERHEPVKEEIKRVILCLEWLSGKVPVIYLLEGNHERRVLTYFAKRLPQEMMWLADYLILDRLSEDFDNVIVTRSMYDFTTGTGLTFENELSASFIMAMGDAVIAHPTKSRKWPGQTVLWFYLDWYNQWHQSVGLPRPALIALGHCHKAAHMLMHGDRLYLGEVAVIGHPGATQGWAFDMKGGAAPPAMGYMFFEQNRENGQWITDINSIYQPILRPSD